MFHKSIRIFTQINSHYILNCIWFDFYLLKNDRLLFSIVSRECQNICAHPPHTVCKVALACMCVCAALQHVHFNTYGATAALHCSDCVKSTILPAHNLCFPVAATVFLFCMYVRTYIQHIWARACLSCSAQAYRGVKHCMTWCPYACMNICKGCVWHTHTHTSLTIYRTCDIAHKLCIVYIERKYSH